MQKTLLMDVKVGQSISIDGGRVMITLEEKSGQRVKIRFVHDGAQIDRAEASEAPPAAERKTNTGANQAKLGIKMAA